MNMVSFLLLIQLLFCSNIPGIRNENPPPISPEHQPFASNLLRPSFSVINSTLVFRQGPCTRKPPSQAPINGRNLGVRSENTPHKSIESKKLVEIKQFEPKQHLENDIDTINSFPPQYKDLLEKQAESGVTDLEPTLQEHGKLNKVEKTYRRNVDKIENEIENIYVNNEQPKESVGGNRRNQPEDSVEQPGLGSGRRSFGNNDKKFESSEEEMELELLEPTKGMGITKLMNRRSGMINQNTRICYACSSISDPTCLSPDRRTTVKYCRIGHNSCATKTYQMSMGTILIRDCVTSCDDSPVPSLVPKQKTCLICRSDLCNAANSISNQTALFMLIAYLFINIYRRVL